MNFPWAPRYSEPSFVCHWPQLHMLFPKSVTSKRGRTPLDQSVHPGVEGISYIPLEAPWLYGEGRDLNKTKKRDGKAAEQMVMLSSAIGYVFIIILNNKAMVIIMFSLSYSVSLPSGTEQCWPSWPPVTPDLASELWTEVCVCVSFGPEHVTACSSFSRQFFSAAPWNQEWSRQWLPHQPCPGVRSRAFRPLQRASGKIKEKKKKNHTVQYLETIC